MERYYGSTSAGFVKPRAFGETRNAYKSRLVYREEERALHRFARAYLFGYFLFVCCCGASHVPPFLLNLAPFLLYLARAKHGRSHTYTRACVQG